MADNNPPASAGTVDAPLTEPTYDEHVEDISKLLDDPETDPVAEKEDATPAAKAEPEDDDPLGLDAEAEDVAADDADNPDGPDAEIKGGRFAPDTAKVTLDDGTVTTIAELKRGTLFQRDYTQKTQALSEEKKAFEAERQQVSQQAQSLSAFSEYAAWYASQHLPKQPEPFNGAPDDYVGFLDWQRKDAEYQAHAQAYQQFMAQKQAQDDLKAGETKAEQEKRHQREAAALLNAIPALKDPVKGTTVWNAIIDGAAKYYGATAEDVNNLRDHKQILILRDAIAYRRIKAKAPEVQAEVQKRPPLREGRRAPANQQQQRQKQALSEQARTGNFDAGVALLRNLNI